MVNTGTGNLILNHVNFHRPFFAMVPFQLLFIDLPGHLTALLRSLVIAMLGENGHEATIEECRRRFAAHCSGEELIPADLRGAIYGTVMAHGDESTLEALIDLYRKSDHQEEKVRLMRKMGGSEHKHVILQALKFAMSVSGSF